MATWAKIKSHFIFILSFYFLKTGPRSHLSICQPFVNLSHFISILSFYFPQNREANMISKRPLSPEAAQIRAEELCARAEHCSHEIREKLLRWGVSPSDALRIIDSMTAKRFIDDARFARAYVRDKLEYSRWGRRKIALGLYQKRIPSATAREALDAIDPERYLAALQAILAAKRRTLAEPDTYDGRTKLFRHAASRGFEPTLIAQALRTPPV